jgi:hypothetical protein
MEAVRTSETSVDNHFTRQYIPEDNSEHHTRRRENLKSHKSLSCSIISPRFTTVFVKVHHWAISRARLIQTTLPHPISSYNITDYRGRVINTLASYSAVSGLNLAPEIGYPY